MRNTGDGTPFLSRLDLAACFHATVVTAKVWVQRKVQLTCEVSIV